MLAALVMAIAIVSCAQAKQAANELLFYHTVRFELRPEADPAELGEKLPVVETYVVGTDLSKEFDIGATYVLRGYDGYKTYLYDPLHLEIDKAGLPFVKTMVSLEITDSKDPQAMEKIAEIHRRRIEEVPGLAELLHQMESYKGAGVDEK
jgi:hypothetical protein